MEEAEARRWSHLQKLLCRGSPLTHPDVEPSEEVRIAVCVVLYGSAMDIG